LYFRHKDENGIWVIRAFCRVCKTIFWRCEYFNTVRESCIEQDLYLYE